MERIDPERVVQIINPLARTSRRRQIRTTAGRPPGHPRGDKAGVPAAAGGRLSATAARAAHGRL